MDIPDHWRDEEPEIQTDLDDVLRYKVEQYIKVGGWYGWDWPSFEKTPEDVIEYLSQDIDRRLSFYSSGNGEGGGPPPINWFHLSLLLAIAQAFGSSEEE